MKIKFIFSVVVILSGFSSFAQTSGVDSVRWSPAMPVVNPSDMHWKPKTTLPPGANATVLYGDPAVGNYDFYGKFPAKYTVPMHWHTNDCSVVMMKGAMTIQRDGEKDVVIKEGGFFMLPAMMQYVAKCPTGCTFLVHGEKPFDIFYRNPKDDPRNKKK
jgi:hypothetical protein